MKTRSKKSSDLFIVQSLFFCLFMSLCFFGLAFGQSVATNTSTCLVQAQGEPWVAKYNPEERHLGAKIDETVKPQVNASLKKMTTTPLPSAFDWRNNNGNYVTPVRNQGNCGSCWVFSSVGVMESKVLIDNQMSGLVKNLSEQALLSFANPEVDNCENGGYLEDAANFLQSTGVPVEGCDEYTASDNGVPCSDWEANTYKITGWNYVSANTVPTTELLKNAIYNQGPIVVGMAIYVDFYYYYSSGVYSYAGPTFFYGNKTITNHFLGNHAIELIGWDDAHQCFIVKNSWGASWGENGFFRIAYTELASVVQFANLAISYTSTFISSTPNPLTDFYITTPNAYNSNVPMANVSDPMVDVSGNAPLAVTFEDTSTSTTPVISWLWNFGDGATSTVQNPTHEYLTPGIYNVSLETGNETGVNVVTYPDMVSVCQLPAANIAARIISGRKPLPVQFTSISTGTTITAYKWNFGDGETSTIQNPEHIYNKDGMYNVALTVMGPEGSSTNQSVVAVYPAPVARITVNRRSGKSPLPVHFTSGSVGTISSYLWNFGDGQTSSAKKALHSYITAGMYTATLTVTGPGGTSTKEIMIVAR